MFDFTTKHTKSTKESENEKLDFPFEPGVGAVEEEPILMSASVMSVNNRTFIEFHLRALRVLRVNLIRRIQAVPTPDWRTDGSLGFIFEPGVVAVEEEPISMSASVMSVNNRTFIEFHLRALRVLRVSLIRLT